MTWATRVRQSNIRVSPKLNQRVRKPWRQSLRQRYQQPEQARSARNKGGGQGHAEKKSAQVGLMPWHFRVGQDAKRHDIARLTMATLVTHKFLAQ